MNALFDSLRRGDRYTFVFGGGVDAIDAIFHEILPDGTLMVAGEGGVISILNPARIIYARDRYARMPTRRTATTFATTP